MIQRKLRFQWRSNTPNVSRETSEQRSLARCSDRPRILLRGAVGLHEDLVGGTVADTALGNQPQFGKFPRIPAPIVGVVRRLGDDHHSPDPQELRPALGRHRWRTEGTSRHEVKSLDQIGISGGFLDPSGDNGPVGRRILPVRAPLPGIWPVSPWNPVNTARHRHRSRRNRPGSPPPLPRSRNDVGGADARSSQHSANPREWVKCGSIALGPKKPRALDSSRTRGNQSFVTV